MPGARPRAVIFDLDEALLDRRRAWQYALEEAVIAVTGRRVAASPLVDEYRQRPWAHALAIVVDDRGQLPRCEALCVELFQRSAMKRLLVHEGTGMALDRLRGDRIEMGAISREPHAVAVKQAESTGLDRFLAVLAPTPAGAAWDPTARFAECLTYLRRTAPETAFVSPDAADRAIVEGTGAPVLATVAEVERAIGNRQ
jgi:phosphoglycolate phosphatase-like HAD superfamily hydrolase